MALPNLPDYVGDFTSFIEQIGSDKSTIGAEGLLKEFTDAIARDKAMIEFKVQEANEMYQGMIGKLDILFQKKLIGWEKYHTSRSDLNELLNENQAKSDFMKTQYDDFAEMQIESFKFVGDTTGLTENEEVLKKLDDAVEKYQKTSEELSELQKQMYQTEANVSKLEGDYTAARDALTEIEKKAARGEATREEEAAAFDDLENVEKSRDAAYSLKNAALDAVKAAGSKTKSAMKAIDAIYESTKAYEGNTALKLISKTVIGSIKGMYEPVRDIAKMVDRSGKLVMEGYEAFARELAGGGAEELLARLNGIFKETSAADEILIKNQMQELAHLFNRSGGEFTEEILAKTAEYMSPLWKMRVAQSRDIQSFFRSLLAIRDAELAEGIVRFVCTFAGGIMFIVRGTIRLAMYTVIAVLEQISSRLAIIVADVLETTASAVVDILTWAAAPEIQGAMLGVYGLVDAFRVHNFNQWLNDIYYVITLGFDYDNDFKLRLREYPEYSEPVDHGTFLGPEKMWKIDHRMVKVSVDFWAGELAKLRSEMGVSDHTYKKMKDYGGLYKYPGKYIKLDNHPYDTTDEIDKCRQIERDLDMGILVDHHGLITGEDKGGHLISDLIPYKKGSVRNFSAFPLYSTTVNWPSRDGIFYQTSGAFGPGSLDEELAHALESMVATGAWGDVYNHPKSTPATRSKVAETNRRDYLNYLHPQKDYPNQWSEVKDWAKANAGKRVLIGQKMKGVTLEKLTAEHESDIDWDDLLSKSKLVRTWIVNGVLRGDLVGTKQFVNDYFLTYGRYPYQKTMEPFYQNLILKGEIGYLHKGNYPGAFPVAKFRNATDGERAMYIGAYNEIKLYIKALKKTQDNIDEVWESIERDYLFDIYRKDVTPSRNTWSYIRKHQTQFVAEIQAQVNLIAGKRKEDIWKRWVEKVTKAGIPLNTNRFHRLSFTAQFNQLIYESNYSGQQIIKEVERVTGPLLENELITTGLSKDDEKSWASAITSLHRTLVSGVDFPVYFGNIHCRIIVIEKPKITCFVVFRGTTNPWEWTVDFDFHGAEFSSVEPIGNGEYKTTLVTRGAGAGDIQDLFVDPAKYMIHRGFYRCWVALREKVCAKLKEFYVKYDVQDVIVTGHSLGAGITQVACMDIPSVPRRNPVSTSLRSLSRPGLKNDSFTYVRPHAYMYASPKVGDKRFSWHFEEQTSESAHVYIDGDPITMVPFFLIPSASTWGNTNVTLFIKQLEAIMGGELSAADTAWTLISRMFKESGLPFDPFAWRTGNKIDWNKVAESTKEMAMGMTQYAPVRGGGVFMRLSYTVKGDFFESAADSGSTDSALMVLFKHNFDPNQVSDRHNINTIYKKMTDVANLHEDLFTAIDKEEFPKWGDAGTAKTADSPPVPKLAHRPNIKGAKLIAICKSNKRHHTLSNLTVDDIDIDSITPYPDIQEIKRKKGRQLRRRKQRRVMEGEYHGY